MKISCLYCGHAFGVDDAYCDYQGLLRCNTCDGLMEVRLEDGLVRSARPGSLTPPTTEQPQEQVSTQAA